MSPYKLNSGYRFVEKKLESVGLQSVQMTRFCVLHVSNRCSVLMQIEREIFSKGQLMLYVQATTFGTVTTFV